MRRLLWLLIFLGCEAPDQELRSLGWVERIEMGGLILDAKLDTGADNCSIHATDIQYFKKKKRKWVRFHVSNRHGEGRRFERRVVRHAKIKKKDGGLQKRPVVRMNLCLADIIEAVECNLVDRSHFVYPALIGRNSLAGNFSINPAKTYTEDPDCLLPVRSAFEANTL